MARTARIAATVTARYSPAPGLKDAFWLDGRLSGRRESRAADITLDREDRGAFYAVFARPAPSGDAEADTALVRKSLERVENDVKRTNRNIDSEINELADCAVEVCGRISISQEGIRQPYFAGIIVKDNEVASVTVGRGCAYLFRGDALYPLTGDDFELEPVDALGNVVHNLEAYCAGTAGTVRYSNIAPLLPDDCLIVCNREVMETLGQREVLRLLYEAEDQCDAAGLIVTSAASKAPGIPVQFMIGFAESIAASEHAFRASTTSRMEKTSKASSSAAAVPLTSSRTGGPAASRIEEDEDAVSDGSFSTATTPPPVPTRRTAPPPPRPDRARHESPARRSRVFDPRSIVLGIVVLVISIGCIYAIFNIVTGGFASPTPTPTPTTHPTATSAPTAEVTPAESPTPTASELATPTLGPGTPTPAAASYTVKSGDSLWGVCVKFYGKYTTDLGQKIIDANVDQYPSISPDGTLHAGWTLIIPPK